MRFPISLSAVINVRRRHVCSALDADSLVIVDDPYSKVISQPLVTAGLLTILIKDCLLIIHRH
jgi:hypothetical protein